jgi:flagellar basal-body rod protein FlgF
VNPPDAMSSAVSALYYWERRQQVLSNNLANADTTGFKGERVFGELLANGTTAPVAVTDTTAGALTPTGNPLDLAMGNGNFFVVNTAQGERLSRGGAFRLDAGGYLTDTTGNQVLGENGPIRILGGPVTIDRTGAVSAGGQPVDVLRVSAVPAGTAPAHAGDSLYLPPAGTADAAPMERQVIQGSLEQSNVNTISSMVDMITVQRSYAAVQKAVIAMDDVNGTISNDLAKPV